MYRFSAEFTIGKKCVGRFDKLNVCDCCVPPVPGQTNRNIRLSAVLVCLPVSHCFGACSTLCQPWHWLKCFVEYFASAWLAATEQTKSGYYIQRKLIAKTMDLSLPGCFTLPTLSRCFLLFLISHWLQVALSGPWFHSVWISYTWQGRVGDRLEDVVRLTRTFFLASEVDNLSGTKNTTWRKNQVKSNFCSYRDDNGSKVSSQSISVVSSTHSLIILVVPPCPLVHSTDRSIELQPIWVPTMQSKNKISIRNCLPV